jgi:site-specific DNA-methyltransferase (adenine-specific)/modification methylase
MRALLAEVGYAGAALARETPDGLQLIDGHLRAELAPDQKIPVLVLDVTEEEAGKLLATFDPVGKMAEADDQKLAKLLAEIDTESEALRAMLDGLAAEAGVQPGGNGQPVEDPEPQLDRAAELQKEWGTALGQLWEIPGKAGVHRVLCGDSTKAEDVGRVSCGDKIEACITDPPYGIGINADGCKKHVNPKFTNTIIGDDTPFDPTPWLAYPRGCIWGATCFYDKLPPGQIAWLAWDRTTKNDLALRNCEWEAAFAWPLRRPQMFRFMWQGAFRDGDRKGDSRHLHATQKPVELIRWCIEIVQGKGAILDPFLGSGTTLIAAEQLGRVCYGIEIEPKYVAVILQRAKDAGLAPKLTKAP